MPTDHLSTPTSSQVVDHQTLTRVHELLMAPNFPPEELIPVEDLVASVRAGVASVHVVGSREDPVAVAVVETLEGTPTVMLAYFATRQDQRGRGVGSALLRELLADITTQHPNTVVLAEIEHPDHHEPHPTHGDPAARLRFYLRLNGWILDVPYFQPPIDEGQEPVYGMLLLALDPPALLVKDGRLLRRAGLAEALETVTDAADPDLHPVDELLRAAAAPEGVRLLGLDELSKARVARSPRRPLH
ncbi:GNAT family N-acetyltransferase [Propionibacteriaceae bacterium Y1923]|uniref:GNAT family N-acetyltransferase n=1 Tax=Aestuariimicrobium sp. Y1814 TaxID=3418742 RepID=UPI003C22B827